MKKEFRSRLSPQQVAEGMNAARKNARKLAKDARMLLDAGSHATAASLAALSIEESGKISILRGLALARDDDEATKEWRALRNHSEKNVHWVLPLLAAKGARSLDDFKPMFDQNSDHPAELNKVKQDGFYTNYAEETGWSEPGDAIDEEFAKFIVEVSELFAATREVTTEEIELWIKHLGPVWRTNLEWQKQALVLWDAEMKQRGLSTDESSMEEFVRGTHQEP